MDLPVQFEDVQVGLETQDIIMPTVNTLNNCVFADLILPITD
jgi:hypothetical protein